MSEALDKIHDEIQWHGSRKMDAKREMEQAETPEEQAHWVKIWQARGKLQREAMKREGRAAQGEQVGWAGANASPDCYKQQAPMPKSSSGATTWPATS